jgi:hypothetical protein
MIFDLYLIVFFLIPTVILIDDSIFLTEWSSTWVQLHLISVLVTNVQISSTHSFLNFGNRVLAILVEDTDYCKLITVFGICWRWFWWYLLISNGGGIIWFLIKGFRVISWIHRLNFRVFLFAISYIIAIYSIWWIWIPLISAIVRLFFVIVVPYNILWFQVIDL